METRRASGCQARLQDSIDQLDRPVEGVAPQRHLALRARVDGGVEAAADLAQLVRSEHERADRRTAAAEDEVVGADPCELQLGLWIANRFSTGSGSGP